MLGCMRFVVLGVFIFTCQSRAQDLPPIHPDKATPKELRARESLKKYALALLCLKEDRLIEAHKVLEEAIALDPDAAPLYREQVNVFLALERIRDALEAITKANQLDPHDPEAWFLAARLQKNFGSAKEYRRCLEKGLADQSFKVERPEIVQQMYLDLGNLLEAEGELEPAANAFTEAAKILDHPDILLDHAPFHRDSIIAKAAETYERIGNLQRKLKKLDQAMVSFQAAQKRSKESAGRLSFHLAQIAKDQGKLDQALVFVDQFLKTVPLGTDAHEFKIELLRTLGKEKEIVPWLEQVVAVDIHNVSLRRLLVRTHVDLGQDAAAEKVLVKLAVDAPSVEVYRPLFKIMRARPNGVAQIFTQLQQAIDLAKAKPPEPGSLLAGNQGQAMVNLLREEGQLAKDLVQHAFQAAKTNTKISYDVLRLLAALADKHRQHPESEAFYRELLKDPGLRTEPAIYGGYLRALWRNRKYDRILEVCEECLKNNDLVTNKQLFLIDKARAQAALERLDESLKTADEAIRSANEDSLLYSHQLRIRILSQAERYDQAEKECRELFKKFTTLENEADIRYLLSHVLHSAKKNKESEEQLLEILKVDPNSASANNDLGYFWADQNRNLPEAEAMIRKAIDNDRAQRKMISSDGFEDNAAYVDSLGWVLFRKGDLQGARKELERATVLSDGDDPVLWDHLGDVYFKLGMSSKAQSAWERSVTIYETENRRKKDERYREVQEKVKLVKTPVKAVPMGN